MFLEEVFLISLIIKSSQKEIKEFIEELTLFLNSNDFDIEKHLFINKNLKEDLIHSTPYTLADLDYDYYDVVDRLKELTISEYSETKIDNKDDNPPLLFVFGKNINNKLIYIKLKIRKGEKKKVVCMSFHYATYEMYFPYK